MLQYVAQVKNCPNGTGPDCLTNIPQVAANSSTLSTFLAILFGVLGFISVVVIVIQAIKFALSQGDPQKAADARKGIIYALVGLAVAVSAEIVVRVVINQI